MCPLQLIKIMKRENVNWACKSFQERKRIQEKNGLYLDSVGERYPQNIKEKTLVLKRIWFKVYSATKRERERGGKGHKERVDW